MTDDTPLDEIETPDLTEAIVEHLDVVPDRWQSSNFGLDDVLDAMVRLVPTIAPVTLDDRLEGGTTLWRDEDGGLGAVSVRIDEHEESIGPDRSVFASLYCGNVKVRMLREGADPEPDTNEVCPGDRSALAAAYWTWEGLGLPLDERDPFDQYPYFDHYHGADD